MSAKEGRENESTDAARSSATPRWSRHDEVSPTFHCSVSRAAQGAPLADPECAALATGSARGGLRALVPIPETPQNCLEFLTSIFLRGFSATLSR